MLMPRPTGDPVLDHTALMFRRVGLATGLLVTAVVSIVALMEPELWRRSLASIVVINSLVVGTLAMNAAGRTRAASWTYIAGILTVLTVNAVPAGGILSPGIQGYLVFVILAGLLLGERAGAIVAAVCATLGLGLVAADRFGVLPPAHMYTPTVRWLLGCLYLGVALFALHLASDAHRRAMARVKEELIERRAAERRLSHALEAGAIGVFDYDPQARHFRGDSRALALTGLTARADGTVPFEAWAQLVHADDRARVVAELERSADPLYRGQVSYRIRRPDGGWRHVESAAYLTTDEADRPASVIGMIVDVTDRQEAARERERLVGSLAERVKELRLLHGVTLLLQRRKVLDRTLLQELASMLPTAWLHAPDCRARIAYNDLEATTPGWRDTPWSLVASFNTSDGRGSIQVNYLTPKPGADEGPFLAEERELIDSLAEMLRTRIEEQVAERQRRGLESQLRQVQKMDALGTLAGGIAHDINNIQTAIGGNAELALTELPAGSGARESLAEIMKAHDRARDLVKRILLFSRRQESVRSPTALAPVVHDALKLLGTGLPARIQLSMRADDNLPVVLVDASQIHQVIMNFGTNAIHALADRSGSFSVELDRVDPANDDSVPPGLSPGSYVRITARDTGPGMSDEVRDRLFEPFFTTKGAAGTGLGLAVVDGIVREHGGLVTVDTALGVGTAFRIYLPAAAEGVHESPPADLVGMWTGTGQHIMYVDDEESLVLLMSRALTRLGYRCTTFTNPEVALQEVRQNPSGFDAIFTDLQMPGMSGVELAKAAQHVRPDMPVLLTSGRGFFPAGDLPSARWVPKPTPFPELSRVLREMFDAVHKNRN